MPPGLPRRPAPSAAGGLAFGDIVRILKQRIFLILFVWFFLTGVTGVLTWYLVKHHERFKAETMIEVESQGPKAPMQIENSAVAVDLLNRWLTNQAQLVKHEEVLSAAFKDPTVTSTGWYRDWSEQNKSKDELYEKLKEGLSVTPIANTSFLLVSFSAANGEDARRIVNTVARKYLEMARVRSKSELASELTSATTQLETLKRELDQARLDKERYISEMVNVPGVVEGLHVPGEQWRALATEATRLEAEQIQLKAMLDNLRQLGFNEATLSPTLQQHIQSDPFVMGLNNMLISLEQEYGTLLGRVGENHRQAQMLLGQIENTRKKLDEVIREKQEEIRQFQLVSTETAWLNALQAQLALAERVSEFESRQRDLDAKLARVRTLESEQEVRQHQYEQLWNYVQQLKLLVNSQETIRVRQIGEAVVPRERSFPRWELNMPVGSFLGLLVGIGLALLLEIASTSIRTPRDLVRHVHIPILGTVPDLDDEEVAIEQIELASHTAPRSMISEAFRTIRTNLLLSSPAERQRTVLVTSSKAEEGKTTVAVNLAIAIGQSGRRVLLVDANFHRPTMHTLFPKAKREGLSNLLIGRGRLEDLVTPTELPNLDVLTCGPIPPNPTELLTSRYLSELIGEATGRYDQIIFDGPPVLLVSDALVLASTVDGVVLVCRAKATSRGVVQRAREQLERVNARIFGAVLNAAQKSRGGYFGEQMRSYYDYQPEEALLTANTKALPRQDDEAAPRA